jgi:hypothetical protein
MQVNYYLNKSGVLTEFKEQYSKLMNLKVFCPTDAHSNSAVKYKTNSDFIVTTCISQMVLAHMSFGNHSNKTVYLVSIQL